MLDEAELTMGHFKQLIGSDWKLTSARSLPLLREQLMANATSIQGGVAFMDGANRTWTSEDLFTWIAERAFSLDRAAGKDAEVLARVREVFASWIGRPLPADLAPKIEEMSGYVCGVLFLRHGGPQLYLLNEVRPADNASIELYLLRERDPYDELPVPTRSYPIGPDTEAAAAGIFREANRVPRVYAEHVFDCAKCRSLLLERDRRGQLPRIYAELAARVARP